MEKRDFRDTYGESAKEIRNTHYNIGTGVDISIENLTEMIKDKIGYEGSFFCHTEKPDGILKKLTNVSKQ